MVWLTPAGVDLKSFSTKVSEPIFGISLVEAPPQPAPELGSFLLDNFDLDHPIFSPYKEFPGDKRPQVEFFSHFKLLEGATSNILARFSDRTPALIEARADQGRAVLFAFSLDESSSDLALQPLLVVLLNRTIEYLVSEPLRQREELYAGADITRVLPAVTQRQFALVNPAGDTLQLSPNQQAHEAVFQLGNLYETGIYRILGGTTVVDMFALNFPVAEAVPQYLDPGDLEDRIAVERFVLLPENSDPQEAIATARFGKELWKLFLLAGFILMLLEMAIAAGGSPTPSKAQ